MWPRYPEHNSKNINSESGDPLKQNPVSWAGGAADTESGEVLHEAGHGNVYTADQHRPSSVRVAGSHAVPGSRAALALLQG